MPLNFSREEAPLFPSCSSPTAETHVSRDTGIVTCRLSAEGGPRGRQQGDGQSDKGMS